MHTESIIPSPSIAAYVKSITVFENDEPGIKTVLPFFADGFPGIMFHQTPQGLCVQPHNKAMPDFFMYGQTIHPITLNMQGEYRLISFQLYPFAVKNLLGINPKELNDSCYNLADLQDLDVPQYISKLRAGNSFHAQAAIISGFLSTIAESKKVAKQDTIQQAIHLILQYNGVVTIKQLRETLHVTERTFERQFIAQVGVSPKQFAKIIRFQASLAQLSANNYSKLTDVVFENGFADQSHFIRAFKNFTGKTPVAFRREQNI